MPTFERLAAFLRDFSGLTPAQKEAFLKAVVMFVADLREGNGFRKSLRVKKMEGADRDLGTHLGARRQGHLRVRRPGQERPPAYPLAPRRNPRHLQATLTGPAA